MGVGGWGRSSIPLSPSHELTELNNRLLNKQVGGELSISEITVKAHRGKMMQKMKADSLPDLVKMAVRLDLAAAPKD
ncbi:MAG: hypothetical protein JSS39_04115 [Nitrospira sp.]|nr:hypothetical protein [Nitrospira sp.]